MLVQKKRLQSLIKGKSTYYNYCFLFLPILFLAEKSIQKQLSQFYKELFTFRFTPQKPRINVELHAFFFQKQCFFLFISLRFGTQFRSIYRLVLCKIEVIASKFEILDLFLNCKIINLRTGFNSCQYFKYLKINV